MGVQISKNQPPRKGLLGTSAFAAADRPSGQLWVYLPEFRAKRDLKFEGSIHLILVGLRAALLIGSFGENCFGRNLVHDNFV